MLIIALAFIASVSAQTWCNKHYMANQSVVPPGGNFPIPSTSATPLLAFRCAPAIRPYLFEDIIYPASIIIDAPVTYTQIAGAMPITLSPGGKDATSLAVTISVNGKILASGTAPLNASKLEIEFSLSKLKAQKDPYNISCFATYGQQSFSTSTALSYLPNPTNSSVTKMDLRTGALMAKPADGSGGEYEHIFPIGFYTSFNGYLAGNLSILDELKEQGFNVVHPVPTFDNVTQLNLVLDRMQDLGLYLMYDMRFSYMNSTAITEQVKMIKSRPNLLLWYTGDEPDGTSDPLDATKTAYDLIYSLDGYHPVSLVLNCQDYQFTAYTSGTDIIMQDTYMIGTNVTWSTEWNTPCTPDFGDCGCDNCKGEFEDISARIDNFDKRLEVLGWDRTKVVWTVPQAFGKEEYWSREPTGNEWLVQSTVGVNHGALGIIPWIDPTPAGIKYSASSFAKALPSITPFILNPHSAFSNLKSNNIDIGIWTIDSQMLLLAANMNYHVVTLNLSIIPTDIKGKHVIQVFDGGAKVDGRLCITFQSTGTGAFLLK